MYYYNLNGKYKMKTYCFHCNRNPYETRKYRDEAYKIMKKILYPVYKPRVEGVEDNNEKNAM